MSEPAAKLETVRRGFELFNTGNLDTLFAQVFHPDVDYSGDPRVSALAGFPADAKGVEEVRAVWAAFFAMFDEVHLSEVELTSGEGDSVFGRAHLLTRGGASEVPIDAPPFHVGGARRALAVHVRNARGRGGGRCPRGVARRRAWQHAVMPPLRARERAQLPDSAFAYIDSRGRRRLPIHDASHVRNALARFGQVQFEDEEARDRARSRLLRAAKKHGIMPIGFINAQLRQQRSLPTGQVTFLLTDIEGSTALLARLDDQYARLLADIRRLVRGALRQVGGREVSARGDDVFAVFEEAPAAVDAALAIQRAVRETAWPGGSDVRLRIGLHRGRPELTDTGYVGISVHAAARICFAAHGGQIVLSSAVRSAVLASLGDEISLRSLGAWRFRGLPEPISMFQVDAPDLRSDFPPLRSAVLAE
jgi:class 3 adenylate cyclase